MSDLGPDFDAQAAEVCGLYLDPPEGAIVRLARREDRHPGQGPRPAPTARRPGRPARREHEYRRNGTQNLFAALEVHAGQVSGHARQRPATATT